MIDQHRYVALQTTRLSHILLLVLCVAVVIAGGYSALVLEHTGHVISGMNNHVVWGLPHVFAVSLIVTASGALNGASLASVFGLSYYKPVARLSVILAMCLLVGGLLVLVLDLGRPDRLIIAMTTYNFRSIFSWNIFLYTGFLIIGALYLWMMMDKQFNRYVTSVGSFALAWRIVLTTGTGCIFGFLVGRNALDSALLAPLFIALSLVMGTAAFALTMGVLDRWQDRLLTPHLSHSLMRMLKWFLLALVYFSLVQHLTNLYITEHHKICFPVKPLYRVALVMEVFLPISQVYGSGDWVLEACRWLFYCVCWRCGYCLCYRKIRRRIVVLDEHLVLAWCFYRSFCFGAMAIKWQINADNGFGACC